MFIPLYPLGIVSEVAIIYNSLSILKRSNLHSLSLPNRLNFSFSYYHFCLVRPNFMTSSMLHLHSALICLH